VRLPRLAGSVVSGDWALSQTGAVQREDGKALMLFAFNHNLDEAVPIEIVAEGFGRLPLRPTGRTDGRVARRQYHAASGENLTKGSRPHRGFASF